LLSTAKYSCIVGLISPKFIIYNILYYYLQPGINPEVRKGLGEAAVKAAKAVNYVGAGKSVEVWLLPRCAFNLVRL